MAYMINRIKTFDEQIKQNDIMLMGRKFYIFKNGRFIPLRQESKDGIDIFLVKQINLLFSSFDVIFGESSRI